MTKVPALGGLHTLWGHSVVVAMSDLPTLWWSQLVVALLDCKVVP